MLHQSLFHQQLKDRYRECGIKALRDFKIPKSCINYVMNRLDLDYVVESYYKYILSDIKGEISEPYQESVLSYRKFKVLIANKNIPKGSQCQVTSDMISLGLIKRINKQKILIL